MILNLTFVTALRFVPIASLPLHPPSSQQPQPHQFAVCPYSCHCRSIPPRHQSRSLTSILLVLVYANTAPSIHGTRGAVSPVHCLPLFVPLPLSPSSSPESRPHLYAVCPCWRHCRSIPPRYQSLGLTSILSVLVCTIAAPSLLVTRAVASSVCCLSLAPLPLHP